MKSSECDDICNLFPSMSLEDNPSSGINLNTLKNNTSSQKLKNKKNKKKQEVLSVNKKSLNKKKKKKKENAGIMEEMMRVQDINKWNEKHAVGYYRLYYGVKKSASGTRFIADIIYPDGSLVCIGVYKRPKLAAMAYDKTAFMVYGDKAMLNFPHRVRKKEAVMVTTDRPPLSSDHGGVN